MKRAVLECVLVVPFLAFPLLIPACSNSPTSPSDRDQLRKWESMGIHDYVIQQQRQCFCPDGGRVVEVVVRADTFASITAVDSLQFPLTTGKYLTIAGLFEFIETSRNLLSAKVEVTWNEQYGYPERVFVDPIPNAIDDEIAYFTPTLTPIR